MQLILILRPFVFFCILAMMLIAGVCVGYSQEFKDAIEKLRRKWIGENHENN